MPCRPPHSESARRIVECAQCRTALRGEHGASSGCTDPFPIERGSSPALHRAGGRPAGGRWRIGAGARVVASTSTIASKGLDMQVTVLRPRTSSLAISSFAFVGCVMVTSPAQALLIAANYEGLFLQTQSYRDLANTAKDTWENLAGGWNRVASHEVVVTMSTADLGATGLLALTYDNHQTANVSPLTGTYLWTDARIVVNSNASMWDQLWWDPTPLDNGEFDMTGLFGTGRTGTGADGKFDAYSILLHELGHVFGFMGAGGTLGAYAWSAYTSFEDNFTTKYTTWTYDYLPALKGQTVAMGGNPYHVDWDTHPQDSMRAKQTATGWISGPASDERILISTLDLNMIGDAFHLVPEPSTLLLLGGSLLGLAATRRPAQGRATATTRRS
jgi:hypothetical protein